MNKNPAISVIMPVFNSEQFLSEAILSILNQDFSDFEFIIIDDGSTDSSAQIIQKFVKKDERIIFLKNEKNLKISESLNRGIKIAKWKYVARMDADDISLPERFSRQIKILENNKKIGVVWTAVYMINEQGKGIASKKYPTKNLKNTLWFFSPFSHPTTMIRRECFEEFWWYSSDFPYAEDLELWFRLSQKYDFYNIPERLLKYRISWNNSTIIYQKEMIKSVLKIRKNAEENGHKMNFFAKISYYSLYLLSFFPKKFIFYFSRFFQNFYVKIQNFTSRNRCR